MPFKLISGHQLIQLQTTSGQFVESVDGLRGRRVARKVPEEADGVPDVVEATGGAGLNVPAATFVDAAVVADEEVVRDVPVVALVHVVVLGAAHGRDGVQVVDVFGSDRVMDE